MAVLRGPDHVFELMNAPISSSSAIATSSASRSARRLPEVEGQGFFELLDEVYRTGEPFTGRSDAISCSASPARRRGAAPRLRLPADHRGGRQVSGIFVEGYDVTERHRPSWRCARARSASA
jgi:hypothetical protein